MLLRHTVRDLVLASWETDPERVAAVVPPGLEPALVDGRHLVTVAALRWRRGRLGVLPLVPFSQLNVRVYVEREGETAVFFLAMRVTPPGLGGALFGFPVRPARLRVRPDRVEAGGLGVSLRFEPRGPAAPSELGHHRLGLFEAAGVRAFRIGRGEAAWRRAEPAGEPRADPLLALGFELAGPPEIRYAAVASFEAELPPRRVASS
ncbi:MAG TPA: DUF2071 domain-containing protein [Gaiellaceae bacterium]|nr:DUF2071 domain-containing protein [Gaiellaceae bacterium]